MTRVLASPGATSQGGSGFGLRRWRVPIALLLLGLVLQVAIQLYPDAEGGHRMLATLAAIGLTVLLISIWLWFFSGFSRRTRALCFVAELVPVLLFRLDGYSGGLYPRLTWRLSAKKDQALVGRLAADDQAATPVDLATTTPHDFPQFLGFQRDSKVRGVRLARDWSQPPRCLWRQPIGAGWSAFAIVGDFAVTQEQRGDEELVVCYELATGKVRWSHGDRGRFVSVMGGDGPRATPTIHQGRVYTFGAHGLLNCLDGATGKVLWKRNVVEENHGAVPTWGVSCSPLIVDAQVIVSAGGPAGHSLVAYQKDTGAPLWHAGSSPASYASPVEATLNGRRQIIIVNAEDVMAHDPTSGKIIWHYTWPQDEPKVPQPRPIGDDRLLISAGYGLGAKLLEILPGKPPEESIRELWSSRALKPKFTNPIVHEGFVYGFDDGMAMTCLDLATGKRVWRGGRYGHGQMLLVDDVFLIQSETGEMVLVEATPEAHRELGRFQALGDKAWNTPALSGPRLLVRNHEEAACYELPLAGE